MQIRGKVILWQDIVVIIALVLYLSTGFLTTFVLTSVGQLTEYAEYVESNPIVQEAYAQEYNLAILQWIEVAYIGAFYYILRWVSRNKMSFESGYMLLSFYVFFILLFFLQNFINDLPYAIKIFLETI